MNQDYCQQCFEFGLEFCEECDLWYCPECDGGHSGECGREREEEDLGE